MYPTFYTLNCLVLFSDLFSMGIVKFLTSKVFLKQLALAIVALLVFSFLVLKWLEVTTNNGEFVEVPDLKGKSLNTVKIEVIEVVCRCCLLFLLLEWLFHMQ